MDVLPECMSVDHIVPGASQSQKRALSPLELELQRVVSYAGAGN